MYDKENDLGDRKDIEDQLKTKTGSNIVAEWMSAIKEIAENGYVLPSTNVHSKDEKFQRIIGMCNAVIMVLKEN